MAMCVLPVFFSSQQNTARRLKFWPGLVPCESDGAVWNWRETSGGALRDAERCWPVATSHHQSSGAAKHVMLQDLLAEAPHRENKDHFAPHLLHHYLIITFSVFLFFICFFCFVSAKVRNVRRILWPGVPRGIWWHRWTKVVRTWLKEVPRGATGCGGTVFSEGLRRKNCRSWEIWKWLRVMYQIIIWMIWLKT